MSKVTEQKYIEGLGRRKSATARVRITSAKETQVIVNGKLMQEYFKHLAQQLRIQEVLDTPEAGVEHYTISVLVRGGGTSAQADAIRLGIARALVGERSDRRSVLKKRGYLKRDPRAVERKKFGLRKARKRPAWSKR